MLKWSGDYLSVTKWDINRTFIRAFIIKKYEGNVNVMRVMVVFMGDFETKLDWFLQSPVHIWQRNEQVTFTYFYPLYDHQYC